MTVPSPSDEFVHTVKCCVQCPTCGIREIVPTMPVVVAYLPAVGPDLGWPSMFYEARCGDLWHDPEYLPEEATT